MKRRFHLAVLLLLMVPLGAASQISRAAPGGSTSATGQAPNSASDNQEQPIQIESASLEVRDKDKMATFSGDVSVVQGDTTIKCQTLVVFYGGGKTGGGKTVAATKSDGANGAHAQLQKTSIMPQGAQDIRRIEARGGVTVVSKDQNASGDLGVYDLKKKTITLTGNVVVSQGQNVIHGDRVVVDTVTGNAHLDSGVSSQNRVRALILPNKGDKGENGPPSFLSIGPNRQN
jgi:lipopolysaccharide export system protein LptA